jgi:hypothetical protein
MTDKHPQRRERLHPGPNQYRVKSVLGTGGKQYGFGLKPFIDPFKMRTTTGPGDYNPRPLGRCMSGVISSKPKEKDIRELKKIPGPGTYQETRDKVHYGHLSTTLFGKDNRNSYFLNTRGFTNPAPGCHSTSFIDKPTPPQFGFGSSKREKNYLGLSREKLSGGPGPGSYRIPVHVGKTPGYVSRKSEKYSFV